MKEFTYVCVGVVITALIGMLTFILGFIIAGDIVDDQFQVAWMITTLISGILVTYLLFDKADL